MTDERVSDAALLRAVTRLPRGSAVVVRHYSLDETARRDLFARIRRAGRGRGLQILRAGDEVTARTWGADGHHGGDRRTTTGKPWLHSMPVHNLAELRTAIRAGADAVLLSPLFTTRSHPGAQPLGPARFAAIARRSSVPVIALGGARPCHARMIQALGASGWAAIDGLVGN